MIFSSALSLSATLALALPAGLLLGSFLNVCISRLPAHQSIVAPGSRCPRCGAAIRPWHNIPLLSFIVLGGRCRDCRQPISLRYPLVEATLAALFAGTVWRFPAAPANAECGVFCFLLLGLFWMDVETMRLPDSFTLTGTLLGLMQTLLPGRGLAQSLDLTASAPFAIPHLPPLLASCFAAAGSMGLLLAIRSIYRATRQEDGLGLGDVKLAAMVGAWLGITGELLTLALGILSAALVGAFLLARRGRSSGRDPLPLGAFLCTGAAVTIFAGRPLLTWYFHFWR